MRTFFLKSDTGLHSGISGIRFAGIFSGTVQYRSSGKFVGRPAGERSKAGSSGIVLGTGSVLGQGEIHRNESDQRPGGKRCGKADVPGGRSAVAWFRLPAFMNGERTAKRKFRITSLRKMIGNRWFLSACGMIGTRKMKISVHLRSLQPLRTIS